MACESLGHAFRCGGRIDRADRKTIETNHLCTQATDVGLCAASALVAVGMALQELIQRKLTAVEIFDAIGC